MSYYVNYSVTTGKDTKRFQAGPYKTVYLAEDHKRDIGIYDGVTELYVSADRDYQRQLMP